MYCGDETGSFIGEIGSHTCRFGYGGEDNPKLVVPSNTIVSSEKGNRRMGVSSLHAPSKDETMESILRMANYGGGDDDNVSMAMSKIHPQTDPNAFLRQGDSVENWDNLQAAWETSMDTLRATDTRKHTQGGTPYERSKSKTTTTSNSGVTSSTVVPATPPSGGGKCIHPILAVTPGMTHFAGHGKDYHAAHRRQQYIQYTEMMMESLDATSMFLAPAPMLAAFSLGRQTALIVDMGAGGCRRRNGRGGDWLGNVTWKAFQEEFDDSTLPKPRFLLRDGANRNKKSSAAQQSLFYRRAMSDLMYETRTEPFVTLKGMDSDGLRVPFLPKDDSMMDVDDSSPSIPGTPGSVNTMTAAATEATYQLPDGTAVDLSSDFGKDLCQLPELLFADKLPFQDANNNTDINDLLPTFSNAPLHKLVQESLLAVGDVDVRKDLAGSICLTGGTSLLPNVETRLSQELTSMLPTFVKPKVVASRFSVERSCASWIGGSILTSLGSFQQLWLSQAEYEEYGAALSIQRFP
ncbi:MAG: hypothetical protein SGARI_000957 [Bacillariaceae sp.]